MGSRARQRKEPIISRTYTVQELQCKFHICVIDFSTTTAASTNCHYLDVSMPGHHNSSAEPSRNQRTAVTQREANFLHSCLQPTTGAFKTTYFHTDLDEALQPTISCLCHRRRKAIQHQQQQQSNHCTCLQSGLSGPLL